MVSVSEPLKMFPGIVECAIYRMTYCVVGYFYGMLIFVIFMVSLQVTKISTHEFSHQYDQH